MSCNVTKSRVRSSYHIRHILVVGSKFQFAPLHSNRSGIIKAGIIPCLPSGCMPTYPKRKPAYMTQTPHSQSQSEPRPATCNNPQGPSFRTKITRHLRKPTPQMKAAFSRQHLRQPSVTPAFCQYSSPYVIPSSWAWTGLMWLTSKE